MELVRYVRKELGNHNIQIIIVTGQPGYAPQREVVQSYEIDGYRLKSELTADKIFVSVYAALRTHQVMCELQRQRHQLERQAQSMARWGHIFEHAEWGIVVVGADAQYIELVNPAFAKQHGYSAEEIMALPFSALFATENRAALPIHINKAYELGHYTFESRQIRKDGSIFPVQLDFTAVKDEDKQTLYSVVNVQDITERKQAEIISLQHKFAIDITHDGFWMTDAQGILQDANRAYAEMSGYHLDELRGMHISQFEAKERSIDQVKKHMTKIDSTDDAIITKTLKGNIETWNAGAERLFGYTANEAIGCSMDLIIPPDRLNEETEILARIISGERVTHFETIRRHKDGSLINISATISPVMDDDGNVMGASKIARDITERKQAEESLLITASVFDNSQEGILITDANNNIVDVNPAFIRITGYSYDEVIGKNPKLLSSGRQNEEFYKTFWQSLQENGAWRGEIWNRRKSGEAFAELLSISAICDSDGKALRYVGVFSDITTIKLHEAELSHVAHFDSLTNIPNRVLLADRMRQSIAKTSREQNMMAVCYLDLDGFKPINDTLGHEVGDEVLIEIAKRIGNTIRGGDTVARLGGDEFVVLLLGLEKGEECVATLERLLASISQPIKVINKLCSVSASVGVSIYPLDDEDSDTLMRHADQAMYVAKQTGKNRFHIYDPALDRLARDQLEFLNSIRHGLNNNEFELFYQPKVNLRTKELVGAEALIRWRHPERGLLSPAEFLHYVDNTDLDVVIGEWVTATALAQVKHWHDAGLDIEVSINISGYHMESAGFVEKLRQRLAEYTDLRPGTLQIEVLETVALNDIAVVREIIESCRQIGVKFALDDFGTGYSSLSYLSKLPVEELKIDQSFVRDMLNDKGDMAIVQGIIALARAFDRHTVAEGIETKDQYQVLLDMGCEMGQGYGIARPMPADKLMDWHSTLRI